MLFKPVTLCLVSLIRGFCPEMDCLEGIIYGGGFVQGDFVRKWLMSRGSYVWSGFCLRGFCPEGVLSAHHLSCQSEGAFIEHKICTFLL